MLTKLAPFIKRKVKSFGIRIASLRKHVYETENFIINQSIIYLRFHE